MNADPPLLARALELSRDDEAGDPFAFRFEPQAYTIRKEDGTYDSASFPWDTALLADLAALSRASPDAAARQRVGELLRNFLRDAGWEAHLKELFAAAKAGRSVHLTIRSAAAELYALPWELVTLRATDEHLGEQARCLVCYEWPGTETALPEPDPPPEGGRILFAWSAAGGAVLNGPRSTLSGSTAPRAISALRALTDWLGACHAVDRDLRR